MGDNDVTWVCERRAGRRLACAILAAAAFCCAGVAHAEQGERREPLIGIYLQPILSATLPSGSATLVTDVYGSVHPTGAVGLTIHPTRRFTLALDLEVQGWTGELPSATLPEEGSPEVGAFALRFLNYWTHVRARIMLLRRGRIQLDADVVMGIVIGREDGERFRAEGLGLSVGLGPVLSVALGNYVALSFSAEIDTGWIFYDVESPQSRFEDASYTLVWPRILIGMGLHGFLAHRRPAAPRPDEASEVEASEEPRQDEPSQVAAPQAEEPAEGSTSPESTPPQESDIESPW